MPVLLHTQTLLSEHVLHQSTIVTVSELQRKGKAQ